MNVGARIKQRRKEIGMSVDALAEKLGKDRATVYRYEREDIKKLPLDILEPISDALGVPQGYLMGWTDEKSNVASVLPPKLYRVPLYESVSAGFGAYADSQIREYYEVYVESPCVAKNTIAIRVKGDSMYPKIEDGDTILVQRNADVKSGDIGVALIDDDAFVKKVEYDPKALRLISINPEYPPKVFQGKEADRVRIVGRVYRIIKEC